MAEQNLGNNGVMMRFQIQLRNALGALSETKARVSLGDKRLLSLHVCSKTGVPG